MKAKGFPMSKLGFVFPGADVSKIRQERKKKSKDPEVIKEPEPKIKIGAITTKGEIGMSFNTDMIAPSKIN